MNRVWCGIPSPITNMSVIDGAQRDLKRDSAYAAGADTRMHPTPETKTRKSELKTP